VNGPRVPPENCPSVRKALRYYTKQYLHWTGLRVGAVNAGRLSAQKPSSCPRYLLHIRQAKARAAHKAWNAYFHYHYAWSDWLPDKYARVGACETGYGKRPGSWTWDSGTYVSAFGIYRAGYNQFARILGLPAWDDPGHRTPREQYLVAQYIQRRFGWGAWGCGGA